MNRLGTFGAAMLMLGAVVVPGVSPAGAKDRHDRELEGDYAFVQTRTCAQGAPGQAGMGENLMLLSNVTNRVTAVRGTMRFDGQGGGDFESEELQLNMNLLLAPAQQVGGSSTTCRLDYEVDAAGRVHIRLSDCLGTGSSGTITGLTFTSSPVDIDAQLSGDRKTLLLSGVAPSVSTVTTHGGPFDGLSVTRVCTRTGTAVRLR